MAKQLYVPKEVRGGETRTALTPDTANKLVSLGIDVAFEAGLGECADFPDHAFTEAGAKVLPADEGLATADLVFRVVPPQASEVEKQKKGSMLAGLLSPFHVHLGDGDAPEETEEEARLKALQSAGVTGVSLEMMPRSTLAQKMDAISSQANLAGYMAVIMAAQKLNKIFPMMMTPSGTLTPAKVFVIGVGVAGLQAIATAKRLGARVTAFDTRAEALEQAESLGAKALRIDLGETGSTEQGYAKELTPEQIAKQQEAQAKVCEGSDVVITTAKLFGRKAPRLIPSPVIERMQRGSVVVDLAAETGGNVEGIRVDEEVVLENGVTLLGHGKFETFLPRDASQMYASNLASFVEHFWDQETGELPIDLEDELLKGCVLTHEGKFVNLHPAFGNRASA
ncbi:MAG: NAD(P) transhydrogenase subunit alpha [Verrucomicrobiota bacterium]